MRRARARYDVFKHSMHEAQPVPVTGLVYQVHPSLISWLHACSEPSASTGRLSLRHLPHRASKDPPDSRRREDGAMSVMISVELGRSIRTSTRHWVFARKCCDKARTGTGAPNADPEGDLAPKGDVAMSPAHGPQSRTAASDRTVSSKDADVG